MEPIEAAVLVLREEDGPLHWTRIQDLALRRGYLDPFTLGDVRGAVLAALAEGVRTGAVVRVSKGVYAVAPEVSEARSGSEPSGF